MQVHVETSDDFGPEQMRCFAEAAGIRFEATDKKGKYAFVERALKQRGYLQLRKRERGAVRAGLSKATGLSAAQLSRLIGRFREQGEVRLRTVRRPRFQAIYTAEDLRLLAAADEAHQGLSGPAMKHVLGREYRVYGRAAYRRLAGISVSHLYNLRRRADYRAMSALRAKTRPVQVAIAERRPPEPRQRPGFIRVDTVHQGDAPDGSKGVYHINTVDTVTQWELIGAVAGLSEAFLLPVLEDLIGQYPFRVLGFHADNGSEYINHRVAGLLNRLLIEFTKSRPYRSGDNALVEGKNGAILRKHLGYAHLPSASAPALAAFYRRHLNPYLNFHRPCGFATLVTDPRGRRRRRYRPQDYATPFERLQQLPGAAHYLRPGITLAELEQLARASSDIQAAQALQRAKTRLFATFTTQRWK